MTLSLWHLGALMKDGNVQRMVQIAKPARDARPAFFIVTACLPGVAPHIDILSSV